LYHYYSELYLEDREISLLWKKTAMEEENHKQQFELAYRLRDEIDMELEADMEVVVGINRKLTNLLEHVRQSPPDIITALSKAIDLEQRLAGLHMENSVIFKDKAIQKLFQALSEYDQDHVKSLQHYLSVVTLHQSEMVG
jgi:rubrerythrin